MEDNLSLLHRLQATSFDVFAVEMLSGNGSPAYQDVLRTCVWIGRFIQATPREHEEVFRKTAVAHLCGNAKAGDSNVRAALIDRFGGQNLAIGNKKCPACKGKGMTGGKKAIPCEVCRCSGWEWAPGPLHQVTSHQWSALAVVVTVAEKRGHSSDWRARA